jgi:hypothetical protein
MNGPRFELVVNTASRLLNARLYIRPFGFHHIPSVNMLCTGDNSAGIATVSVRRQDAVPVVVPGVEYVTNGQNTFAIEYDEDSLPTQQGYVARVYVNGALIATVSTVGWAEEDAYWLTGAAYAFDAPVITPPSGGSVESAQCLRWWSDWDGTAGTTPWGLRPPVGGNVFIDQARHLYAIRPQHTNIAPYGYHRIYKRLGEGAEWDSGAAVPLGIYFQPMTSFGLLHVEYQFPCGYSSGPWPAILGIAERTTNRNNQAYASRDMGLTWEHVLWSDLYWAELVGDDVGEDFIRCELHWDITGNTTSKTSSGYNGSPAFYSIAQSVDERLFAAVAVDRFNPEQLWFFRFQLATPTYLRAFQITSTGRTAGEDSSGLWPWLHQLDTGVWVVGTFVVDRYREWRSTAHDGSAWELTANDVVPAGYGQMVGQVHWRGRDGIEVVAGYNRPADGSHPACYLVWYRFGPDELWAAPVVVEENEIASAPYVLQRRDGIWETGWLIGSTWTRYAADEPSTWEVVT